MFPIITIGESVIHLDLDNLRQRRFVIRYHTSQHLPSLPHRPSLIYRPSYHERHPLHHRPRHRSYHRPHHRPHHLPHHRPHHLSHHQILTPPPRSERSRPS